ncbi:PREDICTED: dynamin-related protein 4C-like [Camelina sativa]|uniref:Dynamin-related protein 4C-like n=1 Tax=Camelina sativa TaxID=90675 RepID=A0ABM0SYJ2_CAMSA|nr:PREDICTED: dynamin-related protein 4C-like [Camelina sativa]
MGGSKMPNVEDGMSSLSIVNTNIHERLPIEAPLVSSYNDRIRPLLDTVDKLRNLNVMREGIQLPTIVVVGDQSSGKSSVLESLAGISLPRGQGICTRVPLVMRLQSSHSPEPEMWLEFADKRVDTDEEHVAEAISLTTDAIAGSGKGVSDNPLTLHVKKAGVPDLTMVDLPGITRVPVNGQPENIYEQISAMIMEYIKPEESIILNVLSATVDFTTCESIRMSRQVDKTGERTLAVVTKADMAPEGLLQKVTADDVSIGLGYVCVRNRIGEETYEEARREEELLFKTHPLLSMIDDEIVGIPVLAKKLTEIQAVMISRCLPGIVQKINEKMDNSILELNKLPMVMTSTREASRTLMNIIGSTKLSLLRILVQVDFSEFPNDQNMKSTARLADMLGQLTDNLQAQQQPQNVTGEFLIDEIKVLEECKSIRLPNFIPIPAFLALLSQRVDSIQSKPVEFITQTWDYIEGVLLSILTKYSANFPQIQSSVKRAGRNLITKIKEQSVNRVIEIVQMEKLTDYTCSPEYMTACTQKIASQETFINAVLNNTVCNLTSSGFGSFQISHLRKYNVQLLRQAFDMKVRITAYWAIVVRRIVDSLALYLQFSVKHLVNSQFQDEMEAELMNLSGGGGVVEKMLEESPSVSSKREKVEKSIKLLKESKDAVAAIVDQNSGC